MKPAAPDRAQVRRDLALLAIGAALLFFLALGARDLWNPNEPAYGLAVAEMAARGDWWIPTVHGQVFAEKPVLYYWLALLVSKLAGGVSEWTLRAPSAAAATIGTLLVYLLALRYTSRGRALLAAALFATEYLVWWSARWMQMDLLVSVTTLAAIYFATRAVDESDRAFHWGLGGIAAGLGFVAKGPVGIVCPALVIVVYVLATKRARVLASAGPWVALLVALIVASPWYVALLARGEHEALREVLLRQNVTRVLAPWDHERAWWYYGKHLWIDFAPWSWLLPLAVLLPLRDAGERSVDCLAWGWLGAILLFFTLSPSKRSPYVLPVAPAVALLVSGGLSSFLAGRLERWRTRVAWALLAAGGVAAIAAGPLLLTFARRQQPEFAPLATVACALALLGGLGILASAAARKPAAAIAAWMALVLSTYLFAAGTVLPALNERKSARSFCDRMAAVVPAGAAVASYRMWELRGSYAFYARRPIPNLATTEELRARWDSSTPLFVIVEESRLAEIRSSIGEREPRIRSVVGNTPVYLFANAAAGTGT